MKQSKARQIRDLKRTLRALQSRYDRYDTETEGIAREVARARKSKTGHLLLRASRTLRDVLNEVYEIDAIEFDEALLKRCEELVYAI